MTEGPSVATQNKTEWVKIPEWVALPNRRVFRNNRRGGFHRHTAPEEGHLVFNPELLVDLPEGSHSLERIESHCFSGPMTGDRTANQLEKTAIELSIQLFALEKKIALANKREPRILLATAVPPGNHLSQWLQGFQQKKGSEKDSPHDLALGIFAAGTILLFTLGCLLYRFLPWKNSPTAPVLFPHCSGPARLGGEHSGGTFVGISFELGDGDGTL